MTPFGMLRFITGHPLNRHAKRAAISRWLRWQVTSRLMPCPITVPFVEDSVLVMERGMVGATGNWYCGLHESEEMGFVLHAVRPDDLFVDIGANIGSYTVMVGAGVGAQVICVEPVPATFARLERNIANNRIGARVAAHCCGLSDAPGQLEFVTSLDAMNRVALPGEALPTTTVPVTTLDTLLGQQRPAVIKIDVEGHERWVLEGGQAVLSSPELLAVLMETNESGARFGVADTELESAMAAHGFSACSYDPFARTLQPRRPGIANTIFVRDVATMAARCQAAPRFRLINGSI